MITADVTALHQIGNNINNPEIQAIIPLLLGALQDPSKRTGPCLQTLLNTKFEETRTDENNGEIQT